MSNQVVSRVSTDWGVFSWNNDDWDSKEYLSDMRKYYQYKIYSSTGQYITTWTDVINDPSFQVVINGGAVELVARLARKTVNFGEQTDIAFGNELRLYCFDSDCPTGRIIFCGYISRYDPKNDGPQDTVEVHVLGYHQLLQNFLFENQVGETQLTFNSIDPGLLMVEILDAAKLAGSPIDYGLNGTLQLTGTIADYQFNLNTASEALDQVLALCPAGWYWYVNPYKNFNLHPKNEQATHTFTLGKEIFYLDADKRMENVINRIYFTGGHAGGGIIQNPTFNGKGRSDMTISGGSSSYPRKVPTTYHVSITHATANLITNNTGSFTIGETIIGQSSGATAIVVSDTIENPRQRLVVLDNCTGFFQTGEQVVGQTSLIARTNQGESANLDNDTFAWYDDAGNMGSGVINAGESNLLSFGISISFADYWGHGVGNTWDFQVIYGQDPTQPILYSKYENQGSIQQYGVRMVRETDSNVFDQATMDIVANSLLDALSIPEIRCIIRVSDNDFDRENGYDIESIQIGDTCQIRNYQDVFVNSKWDIMSWDSEFWDFNVRNLTETIMQIVDIKYTPDYVELTISSKLPNISKRLEDVGRKLIGTIVADNAPSPSVGGTV